MKSSAQWQEELAGETSVQSIQSIQADALLEAIICIQNQYTLLEFTTVGGFAKTLVNVLADKVNNQNSLWHNLHRQWNVAKKLALPLVKASWQTRLSSTASGLIGVPRPKTVGMLRSAIVQNSE